MSERFIPFNHLNQMDKLAFKTARNTLKHAKSIEEIRLAEELLDRLLETAIINYKEQRNSKKKQTVGSP